MIRDRRTLRTLLALALLPALLAGAALWSLGDRVDDTDQVSAAVVNLDEPVTTGSGDDSQTVAAGRLLAAGLTSPEDESDRRLDWQLTDAADARSGLDDGTYDAVVTIPADFSSTVAALSRNEARRATFTVRSADGSGALLGLVIDEVGRAAGAELGRRITGTYLEGLYGETARLGVRLGRAADAADRIEAGAGDLTAGAGTLADGARDLGDGVGTLASGADDLRRGSAAASAGADELTSGLGRLSGGAGTLSSAAGRLARGGSQLGSGVDRLGTGARELDTGADILADGLAELDRGVQPLPAQAGRLADGSASVSEGVSGWARVLRGWQQACAADPTMTLPTTRYAALCAATTQAVGADGGTADQLVAGSAAVASGARELADGAPALAQGVSDAADGAGRLRAGATRLATGAGRLATGADRLAEGAGRIGQGADRLADGAGAASTGAARLASGTTRLAGGAGQLATGATRAADGADSVASGADRLASGAGRLSSGTGELADGLRSGVEALPTMTSAEQQRLAAAVAAPVTGSTEAAEPADATRLGIAPAVLALVLWLGAALVYLLRPALPPARLEAPGLPWRIALAGWRPGLLAGVVQAVLVVPVLALFDVSLSRPAVLVPALLLAGAVFAALVQGVVGLLGPARGRATVLVLLALQALLLNGLLPIDSAPAVVRVLHGLLPVPVAADLVQSGLTGRGAVVAGFLLLVTWGVVGLVLSTRAARRAATVTPADLRALTDEAAARPRVEVLSGRR